MWRWRNFWRHWNGSSICSHGLTVDFQLRPQLKILFPQLADALDVGGKYRKLLHATRQRVAEFRLFVALIWTET